MKKFLMTVALCCLSAPALAGDLPRQLQGEWQSIDGGWSHTMKLTRMTIDFSPYHSSLPPCKFTDVKVANEDGDAFDVYWLCPGDAPGADKKVGFRLMKIWGKEALVSVSGDNPTGISVYQRRK
jgi:hypothetical protein